MSFTIEYLQTVTEDDIPDLPKSARFVIRQAINERLTVDPQGLGKPLRGNLNKYGKSWSHINNK